MALFVCKNCGEGASGWLGKCPSCGEWNTFTEKKSFEENPSSKKDEQTAELSIQKLANITALDKRRVPTGLFELDRVLGGGIVAGEIVLLTGEPGIGKSTLLLQSLKKMKTLYVSGEESGEQIKERAVRLGIPLENFLFSDTLQVEGIIKGAAEIRKTIDLVVIDSIQTIYSRDIESPSGSVAQIRETGAKLVRLAKEHHIPILIVGHVTKDGDIAGPKTLEHMVDAVLHFEGDPVSDYRILRAHKNRFGSTDEIGIFEMEGIGLKEINNPLAFVEDSGETHVPGKAVVATMEGKRPMFFEIQTLATETSIAVPRRVVRGVDYNKVQLLLAVIRKHLGIPMGSMDIYVNVAGGVDVKSPSADLGIAASIISSVKEIPLSPHTLFTGELGLLGEVRPSRGQDKVIAEARRLKFSPIYSSKNCKSIKDLYQMLKK